MKMSGATVTLDPSLEWSPHENVGTKKMDGCGAADEQNLYLGEPQSISQVSLDMMSHEVSSICYAIAIISLSNLSSRATQSSLSFHILCRDIILRNPPTVSMATLNINIRPTL